MEDYKQLIEKMINLRKKYDPLEQDYLIVGHPETIEKLKKGLGDIGKKHYKYGTDVELDKEKIYIIRREDCDPFNLEKWGDENR